MSKRNYPSVTSWLIKKTKNAEWESEGPGSSRSVVSVVTNVTPSLIRVENDTPTQTGVTVIPIHQSGVQQVNEVTVVDKAKSMESSCSLETRCSSSAAEVQLPTSSTSTRDLRRFVSVSPQRKGTRNHNFQFKWYRDFPWLYFDGNLRRVVCEICIRAKEKGLFSNSAMMENAFTSVGYGNWKNGDVNLRKHELSAMHQDAVTKLAVSSELHIDKRLNTTTAKKQAAARTSLRAIFTSLMYLAKQGLAVRGSDNTGGNFQELLRLRSQDISELNGWLRREKPFTSWEIQNEILELVAHTILRQVICTVKAAKFFSLVIDETSDCSVKEQVSISVRIANDCYEAEEFFLGHYVTSTTTGEKLTEIVLDSLKRFGLSLDDLRGQCYDGAANMSGQFRGVQARILELQQKAIYIHCLNHSLNLALQDTVAKNVFFRDILCTVNEVGTILHSSPKRMANFEEKIGINQPDRRNFLRPRPLCPTRWTVRVKSIDGLLNGYEESLEFLEELGSSKDKVQAKAAGLCSQMQKGEFYLGLLMAKAMFQAAECLSKVIQDPSASVSGAIESASFTSVKLLNLKTEAAFNAMWSEMEEKINLWSLQVPTLPRQRKKPKRYENQETITSFELPKERLCSIYFGAIQSMCDEINRRFDQPGIRTYEKLEKSIIKPPPENEVELRHVCKFYGWDYEKLTTEISVLRRTNNMEWSSVKNVITGFKSLQPETRSMFPYFSEQLKHFLVIPCSSAGAERSFSSLRRIKSYLRSTMGQNRLNHCCVINCYSDLVDKLNVDRMLHQFVDIKGRMSTFGKFDG